MDSIIQQEKECYICHKTYELEEHHCLHGQANRKLAEKDGLKVWLCYDHHRGSSGVHGRDGSMLDNYLKRTAERVYINYYNKSISDFIHRYGKNYL